MISLQKLIDRLIQIRDEEHISPNAPVHFIEDYPPGTSKHKGWKIKLAEQDDPNDNYQYVISGDDGYIEHGGPTTEADHEVHIYWEPYE